MAMLAEWWTTTSRPRVLFRRSARDAWLVGASLLHAGVVALAVAASARGGHLGALGAAIVIGLGICWCSNTVSHNHLHNAFFRRRWQNRAFCLWLTLLTGVPQTVWRERHLRHHAGRPEREKKPLAREARVELALLAALGLVLAGLAPRVFLFSCVPGYLLGMALCRLQGDLEHARADKPELGVSHYGALYNALWFNDGFHCEHHAFPAAHWTELTARRGEVQAVESRYWPHLRWLEPAAEALSRLKGRALCALERLALRSPLVQRFVLASHGRALRVLLASLPVEPREVVVIGGGLFPRSLILLGELLPKARFWVVDQSFEHVGLAIDELKKREFELRRVRFSIESFDPARHARCDLVVAPLGFVGAPCLLERARERGPLLTHDWIWQRRAGASRVVSWLLLKRVNLALPDA